MRVVTSGEKEKLAGKSTLMRCLLCSEQTFEKKSVDSNNKLVYQQKINSIALV